MPSDAARQSNEKNQFDDMHYAFLLFPVYAYVFTYLFSLIDLYSDENCKGSCKNFEEGFFISFGTFGMIEINYLSYVLIVPFKIFLYKKESKDTF